MADYSAYPYGRMLSYIERRCTELGDDKKYIEYILSMENAESIERLIKMYSSCYKVLAYLFFGTKKLPYAWYNTETWGYNYGWLIDELNYCLNENILKWYKRQESPSNKQTLSALSNLHESKNIVTVQNEILKISTPQADNGVKTLFYIRDKQYDMRNKNSNYRYNEHDYLYCSGYLAAHGHIFDIIEIRFGKDLGISYDNVEIEYKKGVERKEKRKEEKEKKKRDKKRNEFLIKVLSFLIVIPIVIGIGAILKSVGTLLIIPILFFLLGSLLFAL